MKIGKIIVRPLIFEEFLFRILQIANTVHICENIKIKKINFENTKQKK